jgi:putative hydrolase of the HAD superfamily
MIKNIVFDLGRVLLDFRPLEYLRNILGENELSDKLYKHIFLSDEWLMLDRGTLEINDAIDRISKRIPEEKDYVEFYMLNWYEILVPITGTVETLKKLKNQGYKLYILSNFHKAAFEKVFNKYDWFNNFDGGLISYETHLLKPEPEIYQRLIEKCGIVPEESMFIDDMKLNVESAARIGFNTIQFKDVEQLQSDLEKLKVKLTI